MKTIFFGTPDFSVPALDALYKKTDLCLVVSQEDKKRGRGKKLSSSPVIERARELGIETFQPRNVNEEESIKKLKSYEADLYVVVAYGQILKKELLELPTLDIVNIHASILPKLRGAAPIQFAILEGHEKAGVCIMRIEEGLDSGPVALCKTMDIGSLSYGQLSEELSYLGAEALSDYLDKLESGSVEFIDQDHRESTYAHKIENDMVWLDFYNEDAKILERKIRALNPSPGAKFKLAGEDIKVYEAKVKDGHGLLPGHYEVKGKELLIGSKNGLLSIESLQRPGKKRMDISSFLAGFHSDKQGVIDLLEL